MSTPNQCRFTYQFEDLQKMHEKYGKNNFVVLGFPCDQFDNQNPEDGEETIQLCKVNYGVTLQVNGETTHPLFNYLKHEVDFREFGKANMQEKMLAQSIVQIAPSFLDDRNIHWNFTKFLVDGNGKTIARFEPTDSQLDIEQAIDKIL